MGSSVSIFPRRICNCMFRYYAQKDKDFLRRSGAVCYGASRISSPDSRQCSPFNVGTCWSFIKKAGTIILLSTIIIWFTTYFGFVDGRFTMLSEDQIGSSILAMIGNAIAWIFAPLGWGNWQAAVASITGLVAKENIVGTLGILYGGTGTVYENMSAAFTTVSGYSFLAFNLLCAPCFAAIGAIKREMNNGKWK